MRLCSVLLLLAVLWAAPLFPALAAAAQAPEEHAQAGATSELVFKWINFFLLFGGGAYFLRGLLKRKFAELRQGIQNEIANARQQREQSRARLAEIERRLAALGQEVEAMQQEAAENAAAERQRIRKAAQREAERLLATTNAEIDSASRAARLELRAYAAHLAVTLAEQRIQQQLTPAVHAALFAASLSELPGTPLSRGAVGPGPERRQ